MSSAGAAAQSTLTNSRDLLARSHDELVQLLEAVRPSPVSAEHRAHILSTLPQDGEVADLDVASQQKLQALDPVLRGAARDGLFVVKVVALPQAAIGLHARAVVLITNQALTLLAANELQAIVAHEIGHEYVWGDHERASRIADDGRLRDLELVCDIVAMVSLRTLGQNPSGLLTGLEKMLRFNRRRFGTALNENNYPTLSQRRALARAFEAKSPP